MPTKKIQPTSVLTKWKQTVKLLKSPDAKALKSSDRLSIFNQLLKDIKNVNGLHAQIYLTYFIKTSHLAPSKDVKYAMNHGNKNKIFKTYSNSDNIDKLLILHTFNRAKDFVKKCFKPLSQEECDDFISSDSKKFIQNSTGHELTFIYYKWDHFDITDSKITVFSASNNNLIRLLSKCINIYALYLDYAKVKNVSLDKIINQLIPKMTTCGKLINHTIQLHLLKKYGLNSKDSKKICLGNPFILDPKMHATSHTITIYNYHATQDVYNALEKIQSEYAQSLISNSLNSKNGKALINCICAPLEQLNMMNIPNLFILKIDVPLCIKALYAHHKISITQALTIAITAINSAKALNMCEQYAGGGHYVARADTYDEVQF